MDRNERRKQIKQNKINRSGSKGGERETELGFWTGDTFSVK